MMKKDAKARLIRWILLLQEFDLEEYFPCEVELALLEKQEPALFETYLELMCHLYICSSMHGSSKGASCSLKSWGDYLFPDMKNTPEAAHCGVVDEDIFAGCKSILKGI